MTLHPFYLTFGVQYRREPHPLWKGADPDGWVKIMARDEPEARHVAGLYFGKHWSMLYPGQYFPEALNKAKYYPKGELLVLEVGVYPPPAGAPHPRYTNSDPRFYGVDENAVVAVRVEGVLKEGSDKDAVEALGYEAEHFHPGCAEAGQALFATISEVDTAVRAFELDWSSPYHCEVCQESIT
jgi:hypothetical protein